MRRLLLPLAVLLACGCAARSAPVDPPCATPEAREFDFWLGDWDLAGRMRVRPGVDEWRETRSTNSIRSIMNGCVTLERFENRTPGAWAGMSVSSWNPHTRQWQQTWVDDQGGYITLAGAFADGRMILITPARALPSGDTAVNRMVFHDITGDRLQWDWEVSRDGGRNWEGMWTITYRRRK